MLGNSEEKLVESALEALNLRIRWTNLESFLPEQLLRLLLHAVFQFRLHLALLCLDHRHRLLEDRSGLSNRRNQRRVRPDVPKNIFLLKSRRETSGLELKLN